MTRLIGLSEIVVLRPIGQARNDFVHAQLTGKSKIRSSRAIRIASESGRTDKKKTACSNIVCESGDFIVANCFGSQAD
jgi:hypothetical protein